jgi:hypothetical protein
VNLLNQAIKRRQLVAHRQRQRDQLRRLLQVYRSGDNRLLRKNYEMSWICIRRRPFAR